VFRDQEEGNTRLALSSPVKVGPGETVGLHVRASIEEQWVGMSEPGTAGQVDASDDTIAVLKGAWTDSGEAFSGIADDGEYHALAGSVEYERDLEADLREAKRQTKKAKRAAAAGKEKVQAAEKKTRDAELNAAAAEKKAAAAERRAAAAEATVAQMRAVVQPEVVDLASPAVTPPGAASTSAAAAAAASDDNSPLRTNKRTAGMAGMVHETRARLTAVKKEKTDAERKADEAVSREENVPSPLVFVPSLAWQSIAFSHTFVPSLS
jgi:colicin import membrane protein